MRRPVPVEINDRLDACVLDDVLEDKIQDHSAFSRARHERFRGSDMFRRVFERVVEACIAAGFVGGEGFAVETDHEMASVLVKGDA
jgi:hypothetical protein